MKRIYIRIPDVPTSYTLGDSSWTETWETIRSRVEFLPLKKAEFYHARESDGIWLWCRGVSDAGEMAYYCWRLYDGKGAILQERLFPEPNRTTRVSNRLIRVWIDLESFATLHVGDSLQAESEEAKPRVGVKVGAAPKLTYMVF